MSSRCLDRVRFGGLLAAAALGACASMAAPEPAAAGRERPVLHVAADPNNMPFSNRAAEGFENRIAALIARELGADLEYVWHAQRRGFFRRTMKEGPAELVAGVPTGSERALTTRPYYRSTYVFVSRADRRLGLRSFDDPRLAELTIGVQVIGDDGHNPPPALALARRGLIDNVAGFTVYGDYREESPPARIMDAVASGEIDVAVVWGPLAGYFGARQPVPLEIHPVEPPLDASGVPMVFDISVGVRKGDTALRDRVEAVLSHRRAEIERILDEYHVPRGDPGAVLPVMGDDQ